MGLLIVYYYALRGSKEAILVSSSYLKLTLVDEIPLPCDALIYYVTREERVRFSLRVILHEVKSTFLPCSIRYFSPDFSWKDRIRMREIARAKLTIFNQLTHNCIKIDSAT